MAKKKMTYQEMQKELKQRQATESRRKQMMVKNQKKMALVKQLKDMRFQQSGLGRTVTAGKVIFGRIGSITKGVTKNLGQTVNKMQKPQHPILKHEKVLVVQSVGAVAPVVKKKPFNIEDAIARLPQ